MKLQYSNIPKFKYPFANRWKIEEYVCDAEIDEFDD